MLQNVCKYVTQTLNWQIFATKSITFRVKEKKMFGEYSAFANIAQLAKIKYINLKSVYKQNNREDLFCTALNDTTGLNKF